VPLAPLESSSSGITHHFNDKQTGVRTIEANANIGLMTRNRKGNKGGRAKCKGFCARTRSEVSSGLLEVRLRIVRAAERARGEENRVTATFPSSGSPWLMPREDRGESKNKLTDGDLSRADRFERGIAPLKNSKPGGRNGEKCIIVESSVIASGHGLRCLFLILILIGCAQTEKQRPPFSPFHARPTFALGVFHASTLPKRAHPRLAF